MTADYFAIYIVPKQPVILGRRMNLDAILAYLLFERLLSDGVPDDEALVRAHTEIPLEKVNSVFAGSSAMVPRVRVKERTIYGSFQRFVTALPNFDMFEAKVTQRVDAHPFDKIEKTYQTVKSVHHEYHLQQSHNDGSEYGIWFAGYGDRDRVKNLMDDLRHIGAKRAPIQQPEFFDARPTSSPGLIGHDGTVMRPVPCDSGFEPEPGKFGQSFERSLPPYWGRSVLARDPVQCYVPPQLVWQSSHEIQRVIGVI